MNSRSRLFLLIAAALLSAGCSTVPRSGHPVPPLVQAAADLRTARHRTLSTENRAALYLEAAALAQPQLESAAPKARPIYNSATAELTDLLQEADGGKLWNRPLVLTANGAKYCLRFTPKTQPGIWSPKAFTDFKLAGSISCRHLRHHYRQEGVGGALVGIHKAPSFLMLGRRAPFEPRIGISAPVTATLDFHGHDASLTLRDPALADTVRLQGKPEPLAADFSAPFAYYPQISELWYGLMGLINVDKSMAFSGLYMLQPYDPNRIPVILVHGLISTPQMWKNVINELEADPLIRGRYQFWVFSYPTGNAPVYSALLLRQELARIQKTYPLTRGCILVGHSMGGLVSRMQVTTTGRALWNANFREKAARLNARLPATHPVKQSLIFCANPKVKKVVFICVPHRGSKLAMGSLGALGRRLISLPSTLVTTMHQSVFNILKTSTGQIVLPNSISGLSPKNHTLTAMDKLPINAPYYSIIGDRGKGNTPNSTDGVVPYWSSHLEGARSERIVPGPHTAYDLPETISELKRILGEPLPQERPGCPL
ncbi:MAG: esterase/lipase family protein [Chthoniobacteraceae bacterium]